MSISELHQIALMWAEEGFPVFPCRPLSKIPATANGFHAATTDFDQIDKWWKENPDYNPAFCPDRVGLGVIDLDPPEGEANWAKVQAEHEPAPETYTVTTPRGGKHLYFRGQLAMSVGKTKGRRIAPNIDTRGVGSYVLLPGAQTAEGPYTVSIDVPFAELPSWIVPLVARREVSHAVADINLDTPEAIERATQLLHNLVKAGDVAISGQGGNNRTYALACELFNLGLSAFTVRKMMGEIWNLHCQPPWSDEELDTIVFNGSRYAQNEAGAWAVSPASELFAAALDKLPAEAKRESRSRFYPEDEDEQELGKDPSWLIKDLIQAQTTVMIVGPTQSYKSFLALDICLGVATGIETFGCVPEPGPVFYAALEGKTNIKRARRRAWRLARKVEGKIENFYVVTAPLIAVPGEMDEFCKQIDLRLKGKRPKLIVIDTTSKSMAGLNENDAGDAGRFIRFCDGLIESFGCSVVVIHHTGKDVARGSRGSSAFEAGFDTVIEIKSTRKTKAVEVRVRKHKDAEERELPWTFKGAVIGPSLVFFPTDAHEHANLSYSEDELEPKKIGASLKALGALGRDKSVTTAILASQLATPLENETSDARTARIVSLTRRLGAASKDRLRGYSYPTGAGNVWFLPEVS